MGRLLSLVLIQPLVWLHVALIAVLTSCLSFFVRRLLSVDEKVQRFNALFAEKRRRQQDLQMIPDKYSREALYRVTDDELNNDFNTYLALHYARYVTIYLLPVFLILAWLNMVFSETFLTQLDETTYLFSVTENNFGILGLTVTFVFLLVYVVSLFVGFRLRCKGGIGERFRRLFLG